MKKRGFTLAEVLITLAIIGIVATMTLPALMNNSAEQQAKTGLRKGINTLTEAAATSQALSGVDYSTFNIDADGLGAPVDAGGDLEENSFFGILAERVAVDYSSLDTAAITDTRVSSIVGTPVYEVPLKDGTSILYGLNGSTTNADDGLPQGFLVVYDTNGDKQPNIISNCKGSANGNDVAVADFDLNIDAGGAEGAEGAEGETTDDNCSLKRNRVIRDRFVLRLRGTTVEPAGAAANWAFNN
jgi:prepilin-type N-terminal cleavage/methylation domain-containing protein